MTWGSCACGSRHCQWCWPQPFIPSDVIVPLDLISTRGWTCPVCNRGVAPGQQFCDHGGAAALTTPYPTTATSVGAIADRPGNYAMQALADGWRSGKVETKPEPRW